MGRQAQNKITRRDHQYACKTVHQVQKYRARKNKKYKDNLSHHSMFVLFQIPAKPTF